MINSTLVAVEFDFSGVEKDALFVAQLERKVFLNYGCGACQLLLFQMSKMCKERSARLILSKRKCLKFPFSLALW